MADEGRSCQPATPEAVLRSTWFQRRRHSSALVLQLIRALQRGDKMMTTAVIGATGRIGSEIVRGVLKRGDAVAALVRDPDKARRVFGEPDGLHIRPTRLD